MSLRRQLPAAAQRLWRRSLVLWSVQVAYMAEYRAEIALWALSGLLPFIMLAVWGQAEQRSGTLVAPGFGPAELARYFLCAFVVRQFTVVWVVWQFEEDSLQGRLAGQLLQPLHPLWRHLAAHYAEQATRLPFVLLIAVYSIASEIRHRDNPSDKLLPSFTQMGQAVERMAFTQDRRSGKYLMPADTLASLKRLFIGILLGFGFYLLTRMAGQMGQVYELNPVLASFAPGLVVFAIGFYMLRRL